MSLFLTSNLILTVIAVLYNRYSSANISAKLVISAFATLCWIIPFTLLRDLLPQDAVVNVTWLTTQLPNEAINAATAKITSPIKPTQLDFSVPLNQLFLLGCGIGLLILIFRITNQIKWFHSVNKKISSTPIKIHNGLPVYTSTQINNAVLVGYRHPKIVVNPRLIHSNYTDIILEHEATHFRHFDNYWLTLLQMIRAIYWWNPLLKHLLGNLEELLEHRCDHQTSQSFTEGIYLQKLTDLILDDFNANLPPVTYTGFASAVISKNPNIKRLRTLQEKQTMNIFSKTSAALLLISSIIFVSIPFSSADDDSSGYSNSPIFFAPRDPISINFQIIPLQILAEITSEYYGIKYEIGEELIGESITIWVKQITTTDLTKVLSHLSNTHWHVENDKLSISTLPGGVKNAPSLSYGKEISLSSVNLNSEMSKESKRSWRYDLSADRFIDRYDGKYLIKAKVLLSSENVAKINIEIYSLVDGEYRLDSTPQIVAELGESASFSYGGKTQIIVAERL